MRVTVPTTEQLAGRCAADGEFQLSARDWTGGLRVQVGDTLTGFTISAGRVAAGVPPSGPGVVSIAGPAETWAPMLDAIPARFSTSISLMVQTGLELEADQLLWWQYLPAVERTMELLRPPRDEPRTGVDETGPLPRFDAPVGRYVHVALDGVDHRIYYEEAGQGIPLLMQHTAGAHSVQWRHLFEMPAITAHFRLIAYDLPMHGKSIPPVGRRWWDEPYLLKGAFLRQVPVALGSALELDRPVFMGCSVGGLLALDLAYHHPDVFRAVIAVEGSLYIGGDWESLLGFSHPQVSNFSKARLMEGVCSPTSPEPYVKEVSQVYSAEWPPAFLGDVYYYMVDYDLRERAREIDTSRVGVHILNGEYDWTGTVEAGLEAHRAIAGSTHTEMAGIGHFPMQENPVLFAKYLEPVLAQIRAA
jgi:pimeloyl-ACP methyl ester carboxylesterase